MKTVPDERKDELDLIAEEILTYDGENPLPRWTDKEPGEHAAMLRSDCSLHVLTWKPGRVLQADLYRPCRPV